MSSHWPHFSSQSGDRSYATNTWEILFSCSLLSLQGDYSFFFFSFCSRSRVYQLGSLKHKCKQYTNRGKLYPFMLMTMISSPWRRHKRLTFCLNNISSSCHWCSYFLGIFSHHNGEMLMNDFPLNGSTTEKHWIPYISSSLSKCSWWIMGEKI